ncbi:MAG: asparagine synthase (glutamine-hydrolyzing), partial [Deltaproteobacteria bacterium]|nr:asparagine synthase (glutamine-hydrolyzing) [Deltaproteobacteria bacterium]
MCGIAGIIGRGTSLPASLIGQMAETLIHRGPDDYAFLWCGQNGAPQMGRELPTVASRFFLAHRRLSILDLSERGRQPLSTADGRYCIVYNGEVYNYRELRNELAREGVVFSTQTDSEVVLYALVHWGKRALSRFRGMFAFAFADLMNRRLMLVRDPFGIKPLYYADTQGGVAFASEIPPLLAVPGVSRRLNAQAVYHYLRFGLTDHSSATLFLDIRQLPAAHWVEIDLDQGIVGSLERYWTLPLGSLEDIGFAEAAQELRKRFLDNVELHLRSDVAVGTALSGGIDSSAIVGAVRFLHPSAELHTFSFVADDESVSEERWVDEVTNSVRSIVHKVRPAPEEIVEDLDRLIRAQGEPFGSTSIYAQYRVFQLAREAGIKVMLDGQGADEMLAGYVGFPGARLASLVRQGNLCRAWRFLNAASAWPGRSRGRLLSSALNRFIPEALQPLALRVIGRDPTPHWLNDDWFRSHDVSFTVPVIPFEPDAGYLHNLLRNSLQLGSLPMLLRYEDRNSMAHSIESRVPFLTVDLAEFLFRLPEEYLVSDTGESKSVLREAMRGLIPDSVLDRRDKIGFATPELRWLACLAPWVERTLAGADAVPMLNTA